jgi:hypothetical protein
MNERIRELLKQSTNPPWDGEQGPMNEFNLERFAELIVKECIDVCANGWQGEFTAAGISQCVSDLREHFGVEE